MKPIQTNNTDGNIRNDYIDRNGVEWNKTATIQSFAFPFNIETGVTQYACGVTTCADSFKLFFPTEISGKIIEASNVKGRRIYNAAWTDINPIEFDCFIGILIAMGSTRQRKRPLKELFSTCDAFTSPFFQSASSLHRIKQLFRCLSFMTDEEYREKRDAGNSDPLVKVRWFYEKMCDLSQKCFTIGPDVVIDEQMIPYRGYVPARQYMRNKPDKYGQKVWVLACAYSGYCYRWQVYLGKVNNEPESSQAERVVLDLMKDLPSGYNLTTDNFYTSVPLARKLYRLGHTLKGTMRLNKRDIPEALRSGKNRTLYSSLFAFSDEVLMVSYCCKKDKVVILISTENQIIGVDDSSEKQKPHLVLRYNETKGGVDLLDKQIKEYSCRRITQQWELNFFYHQLDVILFNWSIVYASLNNFSQQQRRNHRNYSLKRLSLELCREHMVHRYHNVPQVPRAVRLIIGELHDQSPSAVLERDGMKICEKRKRCEPCKWQSRDSKTRYICSKCNCHVCIPHSVRNIRVTCKSCESII